ncbi:MAG: OmpA family protein [Casimicrobium sp.]
MFEARPKILNAYIYMKSPFSCLSQPLRYVLAVLLLATATAASADTAVPTQDLKGLTDPPGLARYAGSVLVYRDDVAYDEVKLPIAKTRDVDGSATPTRSLDRSGQRTALQYVTPVGRSALEVVRSYQQASKPAGFETVFECAGEACGDSRDIRKNYFMGLVVPDSYWAKADDHTPAACAGGAFASEFRYAVLDNKSTGAVIAVSAWRPGDVSVYCEEAEFKKRSSVFVVKIEPKAREQRMETLSASEMNQSLTANGKVAVYGILFDTNKSDIKPESKASLDQIGALLKQQGSLKLHVVGHTDNVGNLPANLDLSRRRADAVATTLSRDYGIARDRLTANGVGSLAPVASNASDAGKAKNRRVELVLQ